MRETTREANGAMFMLRCAELKLDSETLSQMSMGMVYDLMIEQGNDTYDYPVKATQADFDSFFGKG